MKTTTETLDANKVKLTIEIDEAEVLRAQEETLLRLTKEVQVPGFRPGRVPKRLLQARLGPKAIREELIREALPQYYQQAVDDADLDVIAQPEIDVTAGEESGPIVFDATVEVRPEITIAGYGGLEVTVPSPEASDAEIAEQIDKMREQFAELAEVDRPARDGDLVTLDVHGSRDGELVEGLIADDIVYEAGTGGIVAELDGLLAGRGVGDRFEFDAADAPGGPAHVEVLVKQIRERTMPELDDAFASDASEFDTLEELRADVANRIGTMKRYQASAALRQRAVEALVALVQDDPPETLVAHEREHLAEEFVQRLNQQRIPFKDYLEVMGQDQEAFLADLTEEASRQVQADLALRALARLEGIEVEESDIDEEIVRLSAQLGGSAAEIREALAEGNRMAGLRSELQRAKAMRWLLAHLAIVDEEGHPVDGEALQAEFDSALTEDVHEHDHGADNEHEQDEGVSPDSEEV